MKTKFFPWTVQLLAWLAAACALDSPELAVLDRIVDGEHAVLLVGDPPDRELVVPVTELPEGIREGHWLWVVISDGRLLEVIIDEEATEEARQRARAKLDELRARGRALP
jgi:hypothetical protein